MKKFEGESFEALGAWTTSDAPETISIGTFTFDIEDGCELTIVDSQPLRFGRAPLKDAPLATIGATGKTQEFGPISLFNGFVRSTPMMSNGPAKHIYYFNAGLVGIETESPEKLPITSVYGQQDLIRVWLDQNLVESSFEETDLRCVTITHRLPEKTIFELPKGRRLVITWDRQGPDRTLAQSSVSVQARPWIGVEFEQTVIISDALDLIDDIRKLISLLSGEHFSFHLISFRSSAAYREFNGKKYDEPFFYMAPRHKPKKERKELHPLELLFTYPSVQQSFGKLVVSWLSLCQGFRAGLAGFFSAEYSTFSNERLFTFTSVAESLHRYVTGEERRPLAQRLTELIQEFPSLYADALGSAEEQARFVRRIVELRNDEAHRREQDEESSGMEMVRLTDKLRVIVTAKLLLQLGIDKSKIENAIRACHRLWFYANKATWDWEVAPHSPASDTRDSARSDPSVNF